jgi:hypothetical protein
MLPELEEHGLSVVEVTPSAFVMHFMGSTGWLPTYAVRSRLLRGKHREVGVSERERIITVQCHDAWHGSKAGFLGAEWFAASCSMHDERPR